MSTEKKHFDLKVAAKRIKNMIHLFSELRTGLEKDIVPHHFITAWAFAIGVLYWRSNGYFVQTFPVGAKITAVVVGLLGYIVWAGWRVHLLNNFLENLTKIFDAAGIKTGQGQYPSFISDREIDTNCRVMTLTANRVPLQQFEASKKMLDTGLFGFIDQIEEDRTSGVVKIFYADKDFPPVIDLDSPFGKSNFTFVVGNTRSGEKIISLVDVPHLLIAGGSNSGKSTLIKQILTTLYLNNPDAEFILIDLKFGLESIEFRDLPKMEIFKTPQSALTQLVSLEAELKERGDKMYSYDCKNIIEYNRRAFAPRKNEKQPPEMLKRKIIIIDEAAQIFMAGLEMTASDVAKARAIVANLAAQGRAVGINLMIGTQRPDINVVDGAIKANLQGRICFHMADNASSMTILDSARAADLPNVKGRAIYRNGPEILEIQVPQIEDQILKNIFNPMRRLDSNSETKKDSAKEQPAVTSVTQQTKEVD